VPRKITRAARRLADGTWSVDNLELTGSGVWTVRVIVNVDGAPSIELDAPIVIEP
jgi:hypothetical protein